MIDSDPITLYTRTGCPDSPRVRDWLVERGVAFMERDVTGDLDAATALYRTGTFATPLLVAGETRVLGFRPVEIEAALGCHGADTVAP
ncbi:MAG: glutaredoxin family protein [Thermomicrobiales bacterium]